MILVTYATIMTALYMGELINTYKQETRETELIDQLLDCEAEAAKQFDEILRLETDEF